MNYQTAILLGTTLLSCQATSMSPFVSRNHPIGLKDTSDMRPCHDLPGSLVTCGSHCFPNCSAHQGGSHPVIMDYNHYIVIPEARSCYIDTLDYGRFDAFISKDS